MYAYIKNGLLEMTSDTLHTKRKEAVIEKRKVNRDFLEVVVNEETGEETLDVITREVEEDVIVEPMIDGLVYDEVIEYDIEWDVAYENGQIIPLEESEEHQAYQAKIKENLEASRLKRIEEVVEEIGKLENKRAGLVRLKQNTESIDSQIATLEKEYSVLTA